MIGQWSGKKFKKAVADSGLTGREISYRCNVLLGHPLVPEQSLLHWCSREPRLTRAILALAEVLLGDKDRWKEFFEDGPERAKEVE